MLSSELNLDIRYYETDQMGIVHHSNYIRYFECGRSAMMKQIGAPIDCIEKEMGVVVPVLSVECKYKASALMGDTIRIVSIVDKLPLAKLYIRTEIYNQNDVLLCTGSVALGFLDSATRRPVRCPDKLLAALSAHMSDK